MKRLLPFLVLNSYLLLLLASCGSQDDIVIEGTLENGAGKTVFIEEMTPESRLFIDSITLDSKGYFKFRYAMPYKTFYNVHVSDDDYIVLLPDKGEHITLTGVYDSLSRSYHLKSGHESQLLWQLQSYTNEGTRGLRDLVALGVQNDYTDSIYLNLYSQQQQYVVHFIEDNLGSLATLIALYKPFNNHPLIDPENSFEFWPMVLEGLEQELPDNPHTINFKNEVERLRFHYAR